ncbi:DUF6279 family lipoprotein [Vibrio gangliei]|uniref:DUF6279 family lipoprotein n=1 Tax=Vibrio gangliei TaxID=2077090 RepID=UPI000D016CD7|nr:DUF6279 family lipoprotein [Vibrio gangliei]
MLKRWFALITLLLLTGCSTQFFYNRLDWFAAQYVDRYVSLNDSQQAMLKQSVWKVRQWHRTQQIPLYIENIDTLLEVKPSEVTPAKISEQFFIIRDFSNQVAQQVIPELYPLFMSLEPKQADELFDNLGEEYQEELVEYQNLSQQERWEKSAKRMQEALESWIGDLSQQQKDMVTKWSMQRPPMREDWIKQKQINKSELQVLYLQRNDSDAFKQRFLSSLQNPEALYTNEFADKVDRNRQITFEMLSQAIQNMSDKQLEHYHEKLRDWRDILQDLNRQG